ncbi:MAG: hypothetical protein HZR80_03895 [Candidatus Heimdallarchaeota archaeon]
MTDLERIAAVITAFEERIQELQAEGLKSHLDQQNDSLFCELASYLVQHCNTSKQCLEFLMRIAELYPNIMLKDVSLIDKVIQICKQEELNITPYVLGIWHHVDFIDIIHLIVERINELHPFASDYPLVQSFEEKSGWSIERIKETIRAFAHWVDEELVPLAQTENYYLELAELLSPLIHNPSRKVANEPFSNQVKWFWDLTQHKYDESPTICYKKICYTLAELDIGLAPSKEWIPNPNKEFHTMFLITTYLEEIDI